MALSVRGYRLALNRIFSLTDSDPTRNKFIRMLFSSFERCFPQRELKPPAWRVELALKSLTCLPYEPLTLVSDKHLTCKRCFVFALASAKCVNELYCFAP